MVRGSEVPIQRDAEGLHQIPARDGVDPDPEDVAPARRAYRRRKAEGAAIGLQSVVSVSMLVFLTVLSTVSAVLALTFGLQLAASTEIVREARAANEHLTGLNHTCQVNLAETRGELARVDRLFATSASLRR